MPRAADAPPSNALHDLRAGLELVGSRTWLWLSIAFFGAANLLDAGPRHVALPFLIHDRLGLNVSALGAVSSAIAVGSVAAAVFIGRFRRLRHRGWMRYGAEIVMGSMLIVWGLSTSLPPVLAAAFIFGIAISTGGLMWTNSVQEMVPADSLGRVTSIDALGSFVLLPLGFAVAGVLSDRLGPSNVFLLGGSLVVVISLLILLVPSIRYLD